MSKGMSVVATKVKSVKLFAVTYAMTGEALGFKHVKITPKFVVL